VVTTDHGPVTGASLSGGVCAFLGIPYAAPPTGDRRFRAPVPATPWSAPRDATKVGPACPQGKNPITMATPVTDEDCLTLNVWTPADASGAPVMVFVHGGSFVFGSGGEAQYDGAALASRGVVVVTLNYRLGALGFLAHPALSKEDPSGVSGNYGLLDQQAALHWVAANAAAFGGDPAKVTLFGESAGAASVCLQMLASGASGTFSKAVLESGTCFITDDPLRSTTDPTVGAEPRGVGYATAAGCTGDGAASCLRALPISALLAMAGSGTELTPNFGPAWDGVVIPGEPRALLLGGKEVAIPIVVGVNGDEGSLFAPTVASDAEYQAAVRAFDPVHADGLLQIYPSSDYATPEAALRRLLGDVVFVCPARYMAQIHSLKAPTFLYQFTHVTALGSAFGWGAFHGSELAFVFGNFTFGGATTQEKALSDAMQGYWTRFATSGDPNGASAPNWPAYGFATDAYEVFDATPTSSTAMNKAKCDALASVFGG
jgi:para-nitrobenzyl esterase